MSISWPRWPNGSWRRCRAGSAVRGLRLSDPVGRIGRPVHRREVKDGHLWHRNRDVLAGTAPRPVFRLSA